MAMRRLESDSYRDVRCEWSLQVLDVSDGPIVGGRFFLDAARRFPFFGLAPWWER
jgi:hypothetical protein